MTNKMVPCKIWQTWKDKNVPDKWKDSPCSIKKFLPDYKYKLYTDEDNLKFVEKHFPDFLPYYNKFKYPIQRADAIRPMRLYVHGGIYMDLDMKIVAPIDHLFVGDLIFTYSANYPSITNMFMASRPKHPIWLDIIDSMKHDKPFWAISKHFEIMMTTGPGLVHKCVINNRYPYTIIPPILVNAYDIRVSREEIEKNEKKALILPLEGGSWHSWDTKMMGTCFNYMWVLIIIGIILVVIVLFLLYRLK